MPYISASRRTARAAYDFAVDGGAAGSIVLRGDRVPGGAVVVDVVLDVTQALAGGTVTDTVALGLEGAADLQAAAARNATPWSTTGTKRLTGPVKTTVDRTPTLVVSTSALTAGRFNVYIEYVEPAS